ncbi:MAG: corrinoid protein [Candidatus Neomarinimicrobiota bacterium]
MEILDSIKENLISGEADDVVELTNTALDTGLDANQILKDGLLEGMTVVGDRFKEGLFFIPEVMMAARAMTKSLEILDPLLAEAGVKYRGTLLIGTVQGDLHDIGKNLAAILFRGAGFKIVDLGSSVTIDKFITKAKEHNPDLIGLSALLTSTMLNMGLVIKGLRENNISTPVIVGGAPLTQEFANSINADIFASSASDGVEKALVALS